MSRFQIGFFCTQFNCGFTNGSLWLAHRVDLSHLNHRHLIHQLSLNWRYFAWFFFSPFFRSSSLPFLLVPKVLRFLLMIHLRCRLASARLAGPWTHWGGRLQDKGHKHSSKLTRQALRIFRSWFHLRRNCVFKARKVLFRFWLIWLNQFFSPPQFCRGYQIRYLSIT